MSDLDKILEPFGDYGHHDNNGYGDCYTCEMVVKAKQAIHQKFLKVRLEELQKLLFNSQLGVPNGWAASTMSIKEVKDRIAELQAQLTQVDQPQKRQKALDEVQPNE